MVTSYANKSGFRVTGSDQAGVTASHGPLCDGRSGPCEVSVSRALTCYLGVMAKTIQDKRRKVSFLSHDPDPDLVRTERRTSFLVSASGVHG